MIPPLTTTPIDDLYNDRRQIDDEISALQQRRKTIDKKLEGYATAVPINWRPSRATGGRKGWARVIESIDPDRIGAGAFDGPDLDEGKTKLLIGSLVMEMEPAGTIRANRYLSSLRMVSSGGGLVPVSDRYDLTDAREHQLFCSVVRDHMRYVQRNKMPASYRPPMVTREDLLRGTR